jgi:hypothetical protein
MMKLMFAYSLGPPIMWPGPGNYAGRHSGMLDNQAQSSITELSAPR